MFIFAFNCLWFNHNDDFPTRFDPFKIGSNQAFKLSFNSITNYGFFTNLLTDRDAKTAGGRKIRT